MNPMLAMTSGVSPRGIDTYNLPPTMLNQHMSLPIIKSDLNDNDPKVRFETKKDRFDLFFIFSVNVVVHLKQNLLMDQHLLLVIRNILISILQVYH